MKFLKKIVGAIVANRVQQAQGYINVQRFYY
jgi:hypothetical protein